MYNCYVYILRCADESYYVGSTRGSLEHRVAEHNTGAYGGYTKPRRPVTLVYHEAFERIADAIAAERQVKGWSRAKKDALIASDFDALKQLSRRRTSSTASFETPAAPAPQDEGFGKSLQTQSPDESARG